MPGQENDEVVTKHVSGFPNYDMKVIKRKSSERSRARFHIAVEGLWWPVWLAGFVQRFKCERGREASCQTRAPSSLYLSSLKPSRGTWKPVEERLEARTIKVVFKELLKVMKSFLNFL